MSSEERVGERKRLKKEKILTFLHSRSSLLAIHSFIRARNRLRSLGTWRIGS